VLLNSRRVSRYRLLPCVKQALDVVVHRVVVCCITIGSELPSNFDNVAILVLLHVLGFKESSDKTSFVTVNCPINELAGAERRYLAFFCCSLDVCKVHG
jgi:hypothetical protein